VANLALLLNRIWAVVQSASYLPGDVLPSPTPTSTPAAKSPAYVQRVRCGGPAYTDGLGDLWAADQPYTPGSWGYLGGVVYTTTQPVQNTVDDPLYQAERYNMATYQFDLPSALYQVELRFAEIYQYAAPNQRIFDVSIEGTKVITGLDLSAVAGDYTAYDRTFEVAVLDGQLNIDFAATKGAAEVNAIKVAATGYVGPTPTPSLDQRMTSIEKQLTELESLLQQILALFDRFVAL
jgi:Malectin domain